MSNKIKLPLNMRDRADFIITNNSKKIQEGSDTYSDNDLTFKADYLFALNKDEMMAEVEAEIDVADEVEEGEEQTYHKETVTLYKPVFNPDYPAIELNQAKQAKIIENDKARDEALNQGVVYEGVLFDSDTDQKVNLLAIVSTMGDEDTITWFGKDNQPLECNKEDLTNIGGLITQLHSFCWAKNAQIKEEINGALTVEAVEAIKINYTLPTNEENSEVEN